MNAIKNIKELELLIEDTANKKIPLYIKWGAKWCQPCKKIQPIFEKLANDYKDKSVFVDLKVDDKEFSAYALSKNVRQLPTFWKIKDRDIADILIGSDVETLQNFVNKDHKE